MVLSVGIYSNILEHKYGFKLSPIFLGGPNVLWLNFHHHQAVVAFLGTMCSIMLSVHGIGILRSYSLRHCIETKIN